MSGEPTVTVWGGTASSADVSCSCGTMFLSTGGDWGNEPTDRPEMPLRDLIELLSKHRCEGDSS